MKQQKQQQKQIKYRQIKKAERLEIAILLEKKYSIRSIAFALGKSPSAISREIKRNSINKIYDPCKANHKAYVKRKYSKFQGMKIVGNNELRNYVENNISKDWSPEEVSGRIKNVDKHIKYASKQGVYKFIHSVYGRQLEKRLRHQKSRRKNKRLKVSQLKNRTFIDKRPKIVGRKQRFGDWEGDFIVSGKDGKQALIVLYERKAMYVIIKKIKSRKCDIVNQYIQEMTGGLVCFNSLTIDNDISFQKHEELSKLLKAPIYFCHAYHSWEKGGVENINKLIRQYISKGSDISKYTNAYIKKVETKLNNRPRKGLKYKTPLEVMIENNQFEILENFGIIKTNISSNIKVKCCG